MIQIKAGAVVLDFALYPRQQIDSQHAGEIREAMKAGVEMPPIKVDRKSKRATDGFHRVRATLSEYGPEHEMNAIDCAYRSEKAMFQDAMRLNAQHGRNLSAYDRAHCILRAKDLGMSQTLIAESLSITVARVDSILVRKTAIKGNGVKRKKVESMAIKRTIGHMAGKPLNKKQQDANKLLGGMNQLFYVNQLIVLFESNLIDRDNDELMTALTTLKTAMASL